ncbi:MAG: hypothetical protein R2941_12640 [Desulfobacterales bacterium]
MNGPMTFIYLIKKNEMDIYDIPIAMITAQYLGYLEWMKAMNIDRPEISSLWQQHWPI